MARKTDTKKDKKSKTAAAPMAYFEFKHGVPEKLHASISIKIPTVPYGNFEASAGITCSIPPGVNPGEALEEAFVFAGLGVKQKKAAILAKLKEKGYEVSEE